MSKKPWKIEWVLLFGAAICLWCNFLIVAATLLHKQGVVGFRNPDDVGLTLLGMLGMEAPALILIFVFLRLHQINWEDAFGFRGPALTKSLLLGAGVVVPALPMI